MTTDNTFHFTGRVGTTPRHLDITDKDGKRVRMTTMRARYELDFKSHWITVTFLGNLSEDARFLNKGDYFAADGRLHIIDIYDDNREHYTVSVELFPHNLTILNDKKEAV